MGLGEKFERRSSDRKFEITRILSGTSEQFVWNNPGPDSKTKSFRSHPGLVNETIVQGRLRLRQPGLWSQFS